MKVKDFRSEDVNLPMSEIIAEPDDRIRVSFPSGASLTISVDGDLVSFQRAKDTPEDIVSILTPLAFADTSRGTIVTYGADVHAEQAEPFDPEA